MSKPTWHLLSEEEKDLLRQESNHESIWEIAVRVIQERNRLRTALEKIEDLGDVRADEAMGIARWALKEQKGEGR